MTAMGQQLACRTRRPHGRRPSDKAFRSGLVALEYTEGNNIQVFYRFAAHRDTQHFWNRSRSQFGAKPSDGNADRLSTLTLELVSLGAMHHTRAVVGARR